MFLSEFLAKIFSSKKLSRCQWFRRSWYLRCEVRIPPSKINYFLTGNCLWKTKTKGKFGRRRNNQSSILLFGALILFLNPELGSVAFLWVSTICPNQFFKRLVGLGPAKLSISDILKVFGHIHLTDFFPDNWHPVFTLSLSLTHTHTHTYQVYMSGASKCALVFVCLYVRVCVRILHSMWHIHWLLFLPCYDCRP